jgi:hypothetical protein
MADRLGVGQSGPVRKLSLSRPAVPSSCPRGSGYSVTFHDEYGPITKTWTLTTTASRLPDDTETGDDGPGATRRSAGVKVVRNLRSGALVIRAGKATGRTATVTLKTSGRTVRLNATTKVRVPAAKRVRFTVKVAAFTKAGVRYRPTTARGTARR